MRKAITAGSAKRVAAAVTAIFNSGDPATAEVMRVWFNRSFKGFSIEPLKDGERVTGYRLTSRYYAGDLSETTTKAPVRRPRAAPVADVGGEEGDNLAEAILAAFPERA